MSFGDDFPVAALMHMPETAMNKNYFPMARKYDIGLAGQIPFVECIAITPLVNQRANNHFRVCICAANQRHTVGSLFFSEVIHLCKIQNHLAETTENIIANL